MSSKEQAHSNDDKARAKRRPATKSQQQTRPVTAIQKARLDPRSLTPPDVLQLQRVMGNRAVSNLLSGAKSRPTIQANPPQKVVQRGQGGGIKEGKGNKQKPPWVIDADGIAASHMVYIIDKQNINLLDEGWEGAITKTGDIYAFATEIYKACEEFLNKYELNEQTKADWIQVRKIWNAMDREMFIMRKLCKQPANIDEMGGGVGNLFEYLAQAEENEYGGVEAMSNHAKLAGNELEFLHFNSQQEWEESGGKGKPQKLRQGWKIHVSATPENAYAISAIVLPILQGCGCEFKVVVSAEKLTEMMTVKGQAGKYITIYPHDDAEALYIGYLVDNALQGQNLSGPHAGDNSEVIVGNSGLVFSRFGAYDVPFVSPTGLQDDNMVTDDRTKPYPSWKDNIWK